METKQENVIPTDYAEVMQKSYIDYAMSVIISRALPDESDDDRYDDRLYCQHHSGSADYFRNRTVPASWN